MQLIHNATVSQETLLNILLESGGELLISICPGPAHTSPYVIFSVMPAMAGPAAGYDRGP